MWIASSWKYTLAGNLASSELNHVEPVCPRFITRKLVTLLEALKFSAQSRIYDSRNALWKMKFGANHLLGLPALPEKAPPLPPGLSSGTKQKKRPAAARDQMASDEESPKSKRQRAAPSSSTPEIVRAARIQRFDPPPNQSVGVEVREEVRGAGSAQVPLEFFEIVEVD